MAGVRLGTTRRAAASVGIALATALIALLATPDTSTIASGPDDKNFHVTASSVGNFEVDYGNDGDYRDGKYRFEWNWTTQSLVYFEEGRWSNKSYVSYSGTRIRLKTHEESNLTVRYSTDPPGYPRRDDSNCEDGPFNYNSGDPDHSVDRYSGTPPWARNPVGNPVNISGNLEKPSIWIFGPTDTNILAGCNAGPQHRPSSGFTGMHGLMGFPSHVDIEIPRGAFNPKFDPSYGDTFPSNVSRTAGDGHEGGEGEGFTADVPHSVTGGSNSTVRFKALSEKAAKKKVRKYANEPPLKYNK